MMGCSIGTSSMVRYADNPFKSFYSPVLLDGRGWEATPGVSVTRPDVLVQS